MLYWLRMKYLGLCSSFEACQGGVVVTHLQLENDKVLFCSATREEVVILKQVFNVFNCVIPV